MSEAEVKEKEVRYRIRKPRQPLDLVYSDELMRMLFVTREADPEDRSDYALNAEFYCHNERCDIRTVRVKAKYEPPDVAPARPRFRCPGCGKALELLRHLKEVALEPVPESE